jgi:hypothetical protein
MVTTTTNTTELTNPSSALPRPTIEGAAAVQQLLQTVHKMVFLVSFASRELWWLSV